MWQVIIGCVKKSVLEGVTLALLGLSDDSVLRSPIMKGNFTNICDILRVEDCVVLMQEQFNAIVTDMILFYYLFLF
jgi:hypothetical protein